MRGLKTSIHTHTHIVEGETLKQSLSHTQVCTHKHINTCILMSIATVHSFRLAPKIIAHVYALMSTSPYLFDAEWMTFETNTDAVCEDCFSCRRRPKAKPRWKLAKMRLLLLSSISRGALEFLHMFFFLLCCSFSIFCTHKNITGLLSFRIALRGACTWFAKGQLC